MDPVEAPRDSLTALALLVLALASPAAGQVRYTVTPSLEDSVVHLRVAVSFRGSPEGETAFFLPRDRFGAGEMYRWITNVDADPPTRLTESEPGTYMAVHEPGADVRISYTVAYDPEAAGFVAFGPSVGPDHFHFFGSQWMARVGAADGPRHIEVRFETEGWTGPVGSSYGIGPGPHGVTAGDYDLDYSVIAGGAYRTARSTCRGRPVVTMVHGSFDVTDPEIFALTDRIVCGQREAFDDFDRPFFTVFITERQGIEAGAPLLHGFTTFLEPEVSREELRGLLAHEMIHTWLPRTARLVDPARPDASEVWTRWFHEGFTEYLARLVLVRQELAPLSWMVERTNEDLRRLAYHPYRTLTLEELERAAEDGRYNQHHHRLHYLRGALLALDWDTRIRAASSGERSLLDPIRRVVARAAASDGTIELPAFLDVFDAHGLDAAADLERHLQRGVPLDPVAGAFAPAYELSVLAAPAFEPGFDLVALIETRRVEGIASGGAAERAGLREGMRVTSTDNARPWSGRWDPTLPTVIVVDEEDGGRRFELRAAGPEIEIPAFVPVNRGRGSADRELWPPGRPR